MAASSAAELTPHGAEGAGGNDYLRVPQRTYVTGILLALGAILMFFMALVSAWVVRKGFSYGDWQPLALPRILWLNTVILIASSASLARSRRFLLAGADPDARPLWGIATMLGALFLIGQLLAWRQLFATGLFLSTNPASSFFYVFTAAHGLHVLGGIAALLAVALRPPRRLSRETATRIAALYWHSMTILWLFLVTILVLG